MGHRFDFTLRTKFIILFLVLTLVPLILLAYLDNQSTEQTLTRIANQNLSIAAAQVADTIDLFLLENSQEIQSASLLRGFTDYLSLPIDERLGSVEETEVALTLQTLSRRNQPYITSYALLDENGINVFDIDPAGVGLDESQQEYYREPIQTGVAHISAVLFSPSSTRNGFFYFSAPVYSVAGEIIGVLRARFSTALLEEFITDTSGLAGPQSFSLLLDENNLILGHSDNPELKFKLPVSLKPTQVSDLQSAGRLPNLALDKLILNLPSLAAGLQNSVNQPIFSAEMHPDDTILEQVAVARLENAPWSIAFAQPQEVFLEPVRAQTSTTFWLTAGIAVIIAVMAIIISQQMSRPIVNMTTIARQVAAGDLSAQVPIISGDERGQLAIAFNDMTTQLRELVDSLEQRVRERTHQLEIGASVGERLSAILSLDELLVEVVNQVKKEFDYYHTHIYLLDEQTRNLVLAEGTGEAGVVMKRQSHSIPLNASTSLVAQAARSGEVVSVDNVRETEAWLPNPLLPDTYTEMAVPIIREGQVVGVLDVQDDEIGGLDEGDANLLRSLAGHVAVALTNARLFEENQTTLKETETLYTISQRMIAANNLSDLIAAVVEEVAIPVINRAVLGVFTYDDTGELEALTIQANWYSGHGPEPTALGVSYTRQVLQTLDVFLSSAPVFIKDAQQDKRFTQALREVARQLNIRAMMILPLQSQRQQLGVVLLEGEETYTFSEQEIRPYLAMLGQLATAVENQHLFEETQQRAIELTQANENAEEARRISETANQAKSEFLANMSHELRTPLNGILGYAQILQRDQSLNPQQVNGINIIHRSGEHLLTLINDILDLARIEARRMELYPAEINLPVFLESIAEMIRLRVGQKSSTFVFEAADNLPRGVIADEKRLRQVLLNLLGNAVKFTDVGEVLFKVSCPPSIPPKGGEVVLSSPLWGELEGGTSLLRFEVKDTGVGMSPAQLEKIFQPFEQVGDVKRRAAGTGLGLAISHQLIDAMGGKLQVKSVLGQGSTFWFEVALPVVEMGVSDELMSGQKTVIGYKVKDDRPLKVLLVDDKTYNRVVLLTLLKPMGFEVFEAEDGQQAIEQAQTTQPDLIMMDLVMPGLTGFEATQAIRHMPQLEGVVIIANSASAFDKDKQASITAGCDAFIPKPVAVPQLLGLLEKHLQLEWIYETEPQQENAADMNELIPPPPEELAILLDFVMRGNIIALEERASHLETLADKYAPFAAKLRQLATQYEDDQILELVEHYMERT